jgi:hypothetical protein
MGSSPSKPKPPPPPPAPPPPPTPLARRPVKQAATPSARVTSAGLMGASAALPRRATTANKKVSGRSALGGGTSLYG